MGGDVFLRLLFVSLQSRGKDCLKVCGGCGSRWDLGHLGSGGEREGCDGRRARLGAYRQPHVRQTIARPPASVSQHSETVTVKVTVLPV
jgi:hypothetical protein